MGFKEDFGLRPLFEGKFISKRQGKRQKTKVQLLTDECTNLVRKATNQS